jgi:CRISPR-associated endoribonuclease Cas6
MPISLYAIVLRLTATTAGVVPINSGQHVHAAFLDLLTAENPELAGLLHDANERKPFTISPLLDAPRADRNGFVHFQPGDACAVRLTVAGLPILRETNDAASLAGHIIALGAPDRRVSFRIADVCISPKQHPLAGATTHDALVQYAQPRREVTLRFITPTSFKIETPAGEKVLALPLPEHVFGGLASRWMSFCGPHPLDLVDIINRYAGAGWVRDARADGEPHDAVSAWRELLGRHLLVTRLTQVQTDVMKIAGQNQVGFTGDVTFEVMGDALLARVVAVLADATFYFGVGRKTTQGMGMTRRLR